MSEPLHVEVSALAAAHVRAAEAWWRLNRPKAPNAIREELERASSLISIADTSRRAGRMAVRARRVHLAVTALTLVWAIPATIVWMLLSQPSGIWNDIPIIVAGGAFLNALLTAAHSAFGVFAIKLLRRVN